MKILITGAKGFVGKNLSLTLKARGHEVFDCDLGTPQKELINWIKQCEFIVHLAGVNRPLTVEEFYRGNADFTLELTRLMEENHCNSPVIFSSSIQADREHDYGKSKRMGEIHLRNFGKKTNTPVFIFRLSNLFGKWSRPHYNSVVATFCHNIARDLPIQISDPNAVIEFVYIDDVIDVFVSLIETPLPRQIEEYYYVSPIYPVSLGKLAAMIQSFKDMRTTRELPAMDNQFVRKLYATYLSYLPEDEFGYPLLMHKDARGSFTEFLRSDSAGQVSVNVAKPGITKGEHWHHTKNEKFLVVSGEAEINFRKIGSDEIISYRVNGDELRVIDIPTGYTHNIVNVGDGDLITLIWASEPFDPENPDTFYEKVVRDV
ncbi:MAG: NAD-dependent epimerase/dehydratase family protein [Bacilli bacterium]